MADEIENGTVPELRLFGRDKIYTSATRITRANVIDEINRALSLHMVNVAEIDYLYWYRRGVQPIINRTKEIRPEICNRICVNNADMVVTFKNGYFLTSPVSYVSRKEDDATAAEVKKLNEFLYTSGKQTADNKVCDWFHTVGVGVIFCEPTKDEEEAKIRPITVHALDPRSAFVVYSLRPGNKPMYGVNLVIDEKTIYVDVITEEKVFHLKGMPTPEKTTSRPDPLTAVYEVVSVEPNIIGRVTIIEYVYKSTRMGAFETALSTMDAINTAESNRLDAVEQTVQNLMVMYNCELPEGETANTIRESGLIVLTSTSDNRADVKLMSESLDQTQTQTTLDDLYEQMLEKCGVPSSVRDGGSTSDNVGAVYLRSGWAMADTDARNTEDLYRESNRLFDEVFLRVLKRRGLVSKELDVSDFDVTFIRNSLNNLLVKTQAALNMKTLGFAPELAFAKSGLSNDPISDVEASRKYIDQMWVSPTQFMQGNGKNNQNGTNGADNDQDNVNGGGNSDGNGENNSSQSNVNAV
jgi:SPP1 family phage portal protein